MIESIQGHYHQRTDNIFQGDGVPMSQNPSGLSRTYFLILPQNSDALMSNLPLLPSAEHNPIYNTLPFHLSIHPFSLFQCSHSCPGSPAQDPLTHLLEPKTSEIISHHFTLHITHHKSRRLFSLSIQKEKEKTHNIKRAALSLLSNGRAYSCEIGDGDRCGGCWGRVISLS